MSKEFKEPMNADVCVAMVDELEGARRATANASTIAPPDPEVAAIARRRQFTSAERTRILSAADACKAPGDIGALLRREGIYSSLLATWREQRAIAQRSALEPQKRGPKADPNEVLKKLVVAWGKSLEVTYRQNQTFDVHEVVLDISFAGKTFIEIQQTNLTMD